MSFRRSDLQVVFYVPGMHAFRVWGYGTTDALEEVLKHGYFEPARGLLHPGELIYVSSCPQVRGSDRAVAQGELRMALVVIGADERDAGRAAGSVRLAQDFGRPSVCPGTLHAPAPTGADAMAPAAPVKRGRGRPPGSRTKKPAAADGDTIVVGSMPASIRMN